MVKGDLHCHSNFSDGSMNLEHLIPYAKNVGLDYLAVTDHDTMAGVPKAVALGTELGLTIIPGVEISCADPDNGRKVHLLCYLPIHPEALDPLFEQMMKSRSYANLQSIQLLKQYHPITEEMVVRHAGSLEQIQKCHIMHALLDLGLDYQIYGQLYHHHFAPNSAESCYYPTEYINIYDALQAVKKSGGICVIAHPGEYDSIQLMDRLSKDGLIDGAELHHPSHTPEQQEEILWIADRDGLILTGGTDFHGYYSVPHKIKPLGSYTTDEENIQHLYDLHEKRLKNGDFQP